MAPATARIDQEILSGLLSMGMTLDAPPEPSLELIAERRAKPLIRPYDAASVTGVRRDDLTIPGIDGAPRIVARLFRPARQSSAPVGAMLWLHGGGYIVGTYEQDIPTLDALVLQTGCVALSIQYRLAPETPYPGAIDDCAAALYYLRDNARELGVDSERIAVGGRSAGGGLAAALALRARDEGIGLAHQHLIYPMLDDRQETASSRWDDLLVWSRELNAFGWRCYLGSHHGSDEVPMYAAPARATELRGLPPTYIHVGGLDGFVHENIDYASRLLAAGVPTELHVFPGAPHGFEGLAPDAATSRAALDRSASALARVLTVGDSREPGASGSLPG